MLYSVLRAGAGRMVHEVMSEVSYLRTTIYVLLVLITYLIIVPYIWCICTIYNSTSLDKNLYDRVIVLGKNTSLSPVNSS